MENFAGQHMFFFCTIEISTPQNHASMQNDRLKSVFVEQKLGVNDTYVTFISTAKGNLIFN